MEEVEEVEEAEEVEEVEEAAGAASSEGAERGAGAGGAGALEGAWQRCRPAGLGMVAAAAQLAPAEVLGLRLVHLEGAGARRQTLCEGLFALLGAPDVAVQVPYAPRPR